MAILTTGGLLSEAVSGLNQLQLVLVTLATCFGGLGLSHVNDSGFWIVTRYLGLSVADGLKTDGADHLARPERLSVHLAVVAGGVISLAY